jgi:hypothetical protein
VRDCGIDRDLRDVAQHPEIIVARRVLRKLAASDLHCIRGLDAAQPAFSDSSHGLRVAREHRNDADILKDVFRGDGFGADPALGEGNIGGDVGAKVVTHHDHVVELRLRIDAVGERWVGRGWQNVGKAGDLDDIRRVTTAGPLGME